MVTYRPALLKLKPKLGKDVLTSTSLPPPSPDVLYTGYTDMAGIVEAVLVLAVTGSAAWLGITTGLDRSYGKIRRGAGFVGGIGSAILGVLYLGGKSGVNQVVGLPAIRVTPD